MRRAIALLLLFPSVACAWNKTGHQVAGCVAYRSMPPSARVNVAEMLKAHPYYPSWERNLSDVLPKDQGEALFQMAGTWADDIRRTEFDHPTWHYVNVPLKRGEADPAGPVIRTNVSMVRGAGRLISNQISRDGTRLLAWDDEKTLSVWELTTGRRIFGPTGHPDPGPVIFGEPKLAGHVSDAVLSPDGLQIAVAINTSGTLTVWNVETGKVLHHNRRYRGNVASLEFSRDGRRILLYSTDTIVRTYDAATGHPLGPAARQTTAVSGPLPVGVSPDGGKMVMYDQITHALRVIDVDRGERLLTLPIDKEKEPVLLWFNLKVSSVNLLSAKGAFAVPLPRFDSPLDDAEPLLQFLTGQRIDETDGIEFVDQFTFKKDPETYRRVFQRWKHPQAEAK